MIQQLIKIANQLDAAGYYDLANELDGIIKSASGSAARYNLTNALKDGDFKKAMDALLSASRGSYGSTPAQELGITNSEYRDLANAIRGGGDL